MTKRRSALLTRAGAATALACLALIAAGWTITLERIGYERAAAIGEAVTNHSNLALAFEEHTIRTLRGLDLMTRAIVHEYDAHGAELTAEHLAEEGLLDPAMLSTAGIIDAHGDVVLSIRNVGGDRVNVADREYFAYQRFNPNSRLHIGRAVTARLAGRQMIPVTRRIDRPDGSFGGVVLVGIDPGYLANFYNHVDLGSDGLVALVGLDGEIRARRDGNSLTAGQDLRGSTLFKELLLSPTGSYVSQGRTDSVARYLSYRVLPDFELVVVVGAGEEHVLAQFSGRARNYYLGAAAATVLVLLFGAGLLYAHARHGQAAAEARRSQASYRTTFDQAGVGIAQATPQGRFLRVNRRLCELLGYAEGELLEMSWQDVTHAEDASRTVALLRPALGAEAAALPEIEKRYRRKDGSMLWAAATLAVVRDAEGAPEYVVTMLQDVSARKQAEAALAESEERFRQLAENIDEVFWLTDPAKQQMLYISPAYEAIWGRSRQGLYDAPRDWIEAIHPEDRARVLEAAQTRQARGEYAEEYRIVRPDGTVRWIRDRAFPVMRDAGEVYRIAGVAEDITERKRAADELRESERRFSAMLGNSQLISMMLDREARVTYCNDFLLRVTGWRREEVLGRNWFELFIPPDGQALRQLFARLLDELPEVAHYQNEILTRGGERRVIRWNNSVLRSAAGEVIGTASIGEDITDTLHAQAALERQAHYDALTGLPNRTLFYDRLEQIVSQARRRATHAAAMVVDLDRFKTLNDTLGHAAGDRLLREAGARIAGCVRPGDTVARVGGDEFALVLADLAAPQDAAIVGDKIMAALARAFRVDGREVFLSASMGIANFPGDGPDGATLVRNASAAMLSAKELGRNHYRFYTAEMNARAMEKLVLLTDLRKALERQEFLLYYQPKACLTSGRITGFEALLRWQHPLRGLVSPGEFIPLLEDSGLIVPVGEWVIRAACAQLAAWREAGLQPLPVAVNLSAKQFQHRDIAAVVAAALAEHALPAALLDLEITESDVMRDPGKAIAILGQLRERGVRIGVDDFGTGYSSLSYLKRLPVDSLKIDRSFVSGLPAAADDAAIARAVITMAHSLGLRVVAEGVETEAQRAFLASHGCDQMQGYLLSRPEPAEECAKRLAPAAAAQAA